MPGNPNNPGNSGDTFAFVGTGSGPEHSFGELTQYAILEQDFAQGPHSSGQATPRAGLPNIFEGQQGDIFATIDFLLTDPLFAGL